MKPFSAKDVANRIEDLIKSILLMAFLLGTSLIAGLFEMTPPIDWKVIAISGLLLLLNVFAYAIRVRRAFSRYSKAGE